MVVTHSTGATSDQNFHSTSNTTGTTKHGFQIALAYEADSGVSGTGAVTILKPLKGVDPGMWESFRSHCQQDYPAYQLVFGVSDAQDPAAELVWLTKYPLSHRGPKKPRPKRTSGKRNPHVATARLLNQQNRHNR